MLALSPQEMLLVLYQQPQDMLFKKVTKLHYNFAHYGLVSCYMKNTDFVLIKSVSRGSALVFCVHSVVTFLFCHASSKEGFATVAMATEKDASLATLIIYNLYYQPAQVPKAPTLKMWTDASSNEAGIFFFCYSLK